MSTHNICFYGEISKIIPKLSSNTLLIFSTERKIAFRNSFDLADTDQATLVCLFVFIIIVEKITLSTINFPTQKYKILYYATRVFRWSPIFAVT